jgi:hypothetical protein
MKSDKPSRRYFAKSMAAAVVTAPLMSSIVKAQRTEPVKKNCAAACPPSSLETDHIPPTVLSDGSFSVELKHKISFKSGQAGSASRPKVYTADDILSQEQYGDIASVSVITEYEEHFSYFSYDFPKGFDPRLKLWFVDDPEADIPPGTEAQILVRGNGPISGSFLKTLYIEMDRKKLNKEKNIKKHHRMKKYEHDENDNRVFRIGKWELVAPNGTPIPGFGEVVKATEATGFRFMVFFYDPTHH